MDELTITLWLFPKADFAAWCELVGDPQVGDFAGYLTLLASVQADQEHSGRTVRRVQMTVAEMRDARVVNAWPNTPGYRAAVVAARK